MKKLILNSILYSIIILLELYDSKAAINTGPYNTLAVGNTLIADIVNGSDSTGSRLGGTPFQHISNAVAAAQSGDTVVVRPGLYNEFNLLKSNVNYWFFPGAIVSNTISSDSVAGAAWGIFDDRPAGAAGKSTIGGSGEFIYINSFPYNVATRGAFVITNRLTQIDLSATKIKLSSPSGLTTFCGVYVLNCSNVNLNIGEISDYYNTWDSGTDNGTSTGLYWAEGEMRSNVPKISCATYGIWAEEPAGRNITNNWYHTGGLVEGRFVTGAYMTSQSASNSAFRFWINCQEISGDTAGVSSFGPAKIYITAQKIVATSSSGQAVYNQSEMWLTAEKITSYGVNLIDFEAVAVSPAFSKPSHFYVQHFEDLSIGNNNQLGIQNGSTNVMYIHGGTVIGGTNFSSLVKLDGSSATAKIVLENVVLDGRRSLYPSSVNINLNNSSGQLELANVRCFSSSSYFESIKQSINASQTINILGLSYIDKQLTNKVIPINGFLQVYQTVQNTTNISASPVQLAFTPNASTNFYPYTARIYAQLNGGICSNITTTETSMLGTGVGSTTLRAGFWKVGNSVTWKLNGSYYTGASPGNSLVNIKLGSTIIASNLFAPTASMVSRPFYSDGTITCITNGTGAVGAVLVGGKFHAPSASAFVVQAFTNTITILDTTVDLAFDILATNGATTTGWLTKNVLLNLE